MVDPKFLRQGSDVVALFHLLNGLTSKLLRILRIPSFTFFLSHSQLLSLLSVLNFPVSILGVTPLPLVGFNDPSQIVEDPVHENRRFLLNPLLVFRKVR